MKGLRFAVPHAYRMMSIRSILLFLFLTLVGCDTVVTPTIERDPPRASDQLGHRATSNVAGNVVLIWGEACLESIRTMKHGPPMTARTLALVHTAIYDAWAAYDNVALGTVLGGDLRRPSVEHTQANKEEAISYAAYRTLVDLFPRLAAEYDAIMAGLGYSPANATSDATTPAGVGNVAAAALLQMRHEDGANQPGGYADYTGYTPVNPPLDANLAGIGDLVDPMLWQPLIHEIGGQQVVQKWIVAHWQYVTPFALTSADQFMPPPPADVKSGEFHRQVQEVIQMQAKLTDRQKVIAEYWADGPSSEFPPGHWCTIAQYVSLRDRHTIDQDVKVFFLVANAVFDASIAAWTAKIRYDYVRPITAIRYLKQGKKIRAWAGPGKGIQVIDGERWVPYQVATFRTPPFSEYVSGHSTFSMAGATVLQLFTGSDAYGACSTFPPGWSKVEPGIAPAQAVTLCWDTFTTAAEEAGLSRLYGGIHFRQGNVEALKIGRLVGKQVWEKAQLYFEGDATRLIAMN